MACIFRSPFNGEVCGATSGAAIHGRWPLVSRYANIPAHGYVQDPQEAAAWDSVLPPEVPAGC